MAKKKEAASGELDLPVTFSGLSVGERTCRLGVTVGRGNYSVAKADKQLCERRLKVRLVAKRNGAHADQQSLPGMHDDIHVTGTCDVKKFSAGGKTITFGCTFVINSIDLASLTSFPNREGRFIVDGIEDIPEGEKGEEGESE